MAPAAESIDGERELLMGDEAAKSAIDATIAKQHLYLSDKDRGAVLLFDY